MTHHPRNAIECQPCKGDDGLSAVSHRYIATGTLLASGRAGNDVLLDLLTFMMIVNSEVN
jgi:hypothetical protein